MFYKRNRWAFFAGFFLILIVSCSGKNGEVGTQADTPIETHVETPSDDPPRTAQPPETPQTDSPATTQSAMQVKSTTPADSQENVVVRPSIAIEFEGEVASFNALSISLNPSVGGELIRNYELKKLEYRLTSDLAPDTPYAVNVVFEGSVVATFGFRTMAGLAISAITPADGAVGVPLDSVVSVQYNQSVAEQMLNISPLLTLSGGPTIAGSTIALNNVYSGEWNPPGLLTDNTTYTISNVTEYTDQSGVVRRQTYSSAFTTPDLFENSVETGSCVNSRDATYDITAGPVSGDFYIVGAEEIVNSNNYPNIRIARYDINGTMKWEKIVLNTSSFETLAAIIVDNAEEFIYIVSSNWRAGNTTYDQVVFKYSTDGLFQWRKEHNSEPYVTSKDFGTDVALVGNKVIVAGTVPMAGDNRAKEVTIAAFSNERNPFSHLWFIRSGRGAWIQSPSGVWFWSPPRVSAGPDGFIYVASDTTPQTPEGLPVEGDRDITLIRVNPSDGIDEDQRIEELYTYTRTGDQSVWGATSYGTPAEPKIVVTGRDGSHLFWAICTFASGAFNCPDTDYHIDNDAYEGDAVAVAGSPDARKIYIAGQRQDAATGLIRIFARVYNEDGTTFGTTPDVTTSLPQLSKAFGVAVRGDGKFAVAGYETTSSTRPSQIEMWLSIYNSDQTDFAAATHNGTNVCRTALNAIAMTSTGEILTAGNYNTPNSSGLFQRYSINGRLIWSYEDQFVPTSSDVASYYPYYLSANNRGGEVYLCGQSPPPPTADSSLRTFTNRDFFVARLDESGDETWASPYFFDAYRGLDICNFVTSDRDGFIYAGGVVAPPDLSYRNGLLAKICPNGTDSTSCGGFRREITWGSELHVSNVAHVNILSDEGLLVVMKSANAPLNRSFLLTYKLKQQDGSDFATGGEPIYISNIEIAAGADSLYSVVAGQGGEIYLSYRSLDGTKTKIARVDTSGVIHETAEYNHTDIPNLTLKLTDGDGTIYGTYYIDDESDHGIESLQGPQRRIYFIAISPDGRILLGGQQDRRLLLQGVKSYVNLGHMTATPDGALVIAGSKFVMNHGLTGLLLKVDKHGNK